MNLFHKKKEPLRFPIKIDTEDGYIEITPYYMIPMLKMVQVHLKGKLFSVKQSWKMCLSDPEVVNDGKDINKKTWSQTFYI